ncbi:four-helix bundle copper-binding protein [Alicyclobacillus suci]|uniref:four-helix bundle copper-binding protein n=1 Tax=Alicyclobacillus suci TaxID=2816080 RepID=UPI001A9053F3|nr:four-helix bundle copper-binding protein [Alicyclobacillus suci]
MPNENYHEQDFDFTSQFRSEGKPPEQPEKPIHQPKKAYHQPPKKQVPWEESPSSPDMQVSMEVESEPSPMYHMKKPMKQHVQPTYKPPVAQPKPQPKAQPQQTEFMYMQYEYEFEEEKLEFDPGLFAVHPIHQCPNICEQVKDCMLTCERTLHMLMCRPDAYMRARQIAMLQDCVEVCQLTTRQIARRSPMLKLTLRYCAKVCQMCAHECMRLPDPESQNCCRISLHCAKICEKFLKCQKWA